MKDQAGKIKLQKYLYILLLLIICLNFTSLSVANSHIRGIITGNNVHLRSGPSIKSKIKKVLKYRQSILILGYQKKWIKVRMNRRYVGWVYRSYVGYRRLITSRSRFGRVKTDKVCSLAVNYLGTKYRYGGNTPRGFDCSGFTKYIYSKLGYRLNRRAKNQTLNGMAVPKSKLRRGDLVFFSRYINNRITHVGIYIGNNNFIHASSKRRKIKVSSLHNRYFARRFVCARRIINNKDYYLYKGKDLIQLLKIMKKNSY